MPARLPPAPDFVSRALPEPAPVPTEGGVAGQVLTNLSERIDGMLAQRNRTLDRRAEQRAFDAGIAAGEGQPGAQMTGGGELYRSAFNRGADEASRNRLEISARYEFERLARQHAANPEAFGAAVTEWRDAQLSTLPENLRVRLAPSLDNIARPYLSVIVQQQDRAVADERLGSFQVLLPQRLGEITRLAERGLADPEAQTRIAEVRAQTERDLIALGPRHAFTFNGRSYPADPSRAGAYSLVQIARHLNESQDAELEGLARGEWRRSPRTEAWITEFEDRGVRGDIPGLRPEQARSLAAAFRRERGQERAAASEGQREARRDLQPTLDANRAAYLETGAPIETISDERLQAAGIDVRTHRAQETTWRNAWQARQDLNGMTDPAGAQAVADRFAPGTALFAADPQLAVRIREEARQRGARIAAASLDQALRDGVASLTAGGAAAVRNARAVPEAWMPYIQAGAQRHGLPVYMLRAQFGTESGGNARAVSPAGATGAAQILPSTAANPGMGMAPLPAEALTDPARALPWAIELMARLRDRYNGNLEYALAAYNWGSGHVDRWIAAGADRSRLPRETQQYVSIMMAAAHVEGVTGPGGDPRAGPPGSPGTSATMPPLIPPEQARAAGMSPEEMARANAQAEEMIRASRIRELVRTGTPEERAAAEAQLSAIGPRAHEDQQLSRVWAETYAERQRGIRDDAAAYFAQFSPAMQQMQQRVMQGDLAALPQLIATVGAEQERQQVPEAQRRVLPQNVMQGLVQHVMQPAQEAERLPRLQRILAAVPDPDQRQALLSGLAAAELPAHLATAAAIAPRTGGATSARIAAELSTDIRSLHLTAALTRDIRTQVRTAWAASDAAGGLRAEQYNHTGNAQFFSRAAEDEARLQHVVSVRAAPAGAVTAATVTGAYRDLYGGVEPVNRDGVLALLPRGGDVDRLARGLATIRDRALAERYPGTERAAVTARTATANGGRWIDVAPGLLAFFPPGSPYPELRGDGTPLVVRIQDALAAAPPDAAPARASPEQIWQRMNHDRRRPLSAADAADLTVRRSEAPPDPQPPPPPRPARAPVRQPIYGPDPAEATSP